MTREQFAAYARKAASYGIDVYLNRNISGEPYAVLTDGTRIGKMHSAGFGIDGVCLTTVHKPCIEYGTGFSCQKGDGFLTLDELTEEKVREAFATVPRAFGHADTAKIRKWRDFAEWKEKAGTASFYEDEPVKAATA